jgi:hypothetical protein
MADIEREVETSGNLLEIASRDAADMPGPLDAEVQQTASAIRNKLEPLIADPVLGACLTRFDVAVRNICCAQCCTAAQARSRALGCRICYGNHMLDSLIVANEGACIQQLHSLFQTALEISTEYYSWAGVPGEKLATVSFTTNQIQAGDLSNDLPRPVHARGSVDIDRNGSRIELNLVPRSFNRDTYESIFYILLHECVCHIFQGTIDAAGERAVLGNSDAFAEGWMDYVTHLILIQLTLGNGPFGDRWYSRVGGDSFAEAGSAIHRHRTDGTREGLPTSYDRAKAAARATRAAFEWSLRACALATFEVPLRARSRAEEKLIQLSAQFNLLPWDDDARENLVTDVLFLDQLDRDTLYRYAGDYLDGGTLADAEHFARRLRLRRSSLFRPYSLAK